MTDFTKIFALVTGIVACVVGFVGSIGYHYGDKAMTETIAVLVFLVVLLGLCAAIAAILSGKF